MESPNTCRWEFPPVSEWPDDDLVVLGADLAPDTLLYAYAHGLFPMNVSAGRQSALGWWSPMQRGVVPLDGLRLSRSLRRSIRRFAFTVNAAFEVVVAHCATTHETGNWITPDFERAYADMHRLGHAHSVEVWDHNGTLVGGLYGVRVNNLFAGESMFHLATDASKAALVHLVDLMRVEGMTLLDTQWRTDHLATLGCVDIPRAEYLTLLARAVGNQPNHHPDTAS